MKFEQIVELPMPYASMYAKEDCVRCSNECDIVEMVSDELGGLYCTELCLRAARSLEIAFQEAVLFDELMNKEEN